MDNTPEFRRRSAGGRSLRNQTPSCCIRSRGNYSLPDVEVDVAHLMTQSVCPGSKGADCSAARRRWHMALAAGEKKKDRRQGSSLGAGHDAFKEDGERKGEAERAKQG